MDAINKRILVVDDEAGLRDAYRLILEPRGQNVIVPSSRHGSPVSPLESPSVKFEVAYAATGEEALRKIAAAVDTGAPFAGGFFDVKLGPGMDGIETILRARELDPDLHYVVVTAYQDRTIEELSRLFGEDFADRWDFLAKPFLNAEILQKARHLVSHWDRRHREREQAYQIEMQARSLVRAERLAAAGTLARGIGHEFGNILLGMIGRAEVALQRGAEEEMRTALKTIITAAERAGVIVRNLQSFVKREGKRETGEIREPVREALDLVRHELTRSGVKVSEEYAGPLPPLKINRVEMGQVFLNLFLNAIHAMQPEGGELSLRGYPRDGGVAIEVRDTGCGIPPENLEKIFEPLFTTKGERGSGIGLSVSRDIVKHHGGEITVKSKAGEGATFTVWLPVQTS